MPGNCGRHDHYQDSVNKEIFTRPWLYAKYLKRVKAFDSKNDPTGPIFALYQALGL